MPPNDRLQVCFALAVTVATVNAIIKRMVQINSADADRFRTIITTILQAITERANRNPSDDIRTQAIIDRTNDHYLLLDVGWTAKKRLRSIVAYIRIIDGKIWVEEDWTEHGIANYLVEAGVAKEAIVLGFQPPELRPLTDFAAA